VITLEECVVVSAHRLGHENATGLNWSKIDGNENLKWDHGVFVISFLIFWVFSYIYTDML